MALLPLASIFFGPTGPPQRTLGLLQGLQLGGLGGSAGSLQLTSGLLLGLLPGPRLEPTGPQPLTLLRLLLGLLQGLLAGLLVGAHLGLTGFWLQALGLVLGLLPWILGPTLPPLGL